MKFAAIALTAAALLAGCSAMKAPTCVQPDAVEPASSCWNQGLNCAQGIGNTK